MSRDGLMLSVVDAHVAITSFACVRLCIYYFVCERRFMSINYDRLPCNLSVSFDHAYSHIFTF